MSETGSAFRDFVAFVRPRLTGDEKAERVNLLRPPLRAFGHAWDFRGRRQP